MTHPLSSLACCPSPCFHDLYTPHTDYDFSDSAGLVAIKGGGGGPCLHALSTLTMTFLTPLDSLLLMVVVVVVVVVALVGQRPLEVP
jgi:hypothetical protein